MTSAAIAVALPAATTTLAAPPPSHNTSDIYIDTEEVVKAEGGYDLPHKGCFLETSHIFELLKTEQQTTEKIPDGTKENQFYLINNVANLQRRKNKQKSRFWDDCGAWKWGPTTDRMFICDDNTRTEVTRKDSLYGITHVKQEKGKRQTIFTPLTKQPLPHEVIHLHRAYVKHSLNKEYRRRISWTDDKTTAVVEYSGTFAPHGGTNCERPRKCIRAKPVILNHIKHETQTQTQTPSEVMQTRVEMDVEVGGVKSKNQIENATYRGKLQQEETTTHKDNFAHHILTLMNSTQTIEFVQDIHISKNDKVPCVILYTDDQIQDIKRFCCSAPQTQTTVLGFDKTFNLGDIHVTLAVFKNLAITRRDSNEHPIFPGPLFLHGNSDYLTYLNFFSHLSGRLQGTPSQPVFGTNDEIAMKQAIQTSFPQSSALSCTRHLKQNIDEYLRDTIGTNHTDRSAITTSIFGPAGITKADDQVIFDLRMETTIAIYTATSPSFDKYFKDRVTPLLRTNFATAMSAQSTPSLINWTNNNCESMNAVLKHCTNWEAQPLTDLVLKLYNVVQTRYHDVKQALVGQGDYILCPQYSIFKIPIHIWTRLPHQRRDKHYNKFQKHTPPVNQKAITTTNGTLTVTAPINGGKKHGQVKRKRSAKTLSLAKRRRLP